jgi:nucleotide-binding universal stress UspA family protein
MKKILVPVDFSPEANNAAQYAASLAKQLGAELNLLYVFHIPVPATQVPYPVDFPSLEKENNQLLEQLAKELELKHQIVPKFKIAPGFAVEEVLEEIEAGQSDLVVMGTKGAGNKIRFLLGSTSADVMRKSKIPVLVIPGTAQFKKPQTILLASDFHKLANPDLFKTLTGLCTHFGSNLNLLNIALPGDHPGLDKVSAERQLGDLLKGTRHQVYYREDADVEDGLNKFLDQHPADMLVIVPHQHSMMERIFMKTHSKNITLHANIPVLAIHDLTKEE